MVMSAKTMMMVVMPVPVVMAVVVPMIMPVGMTGMLVGGRIHRRYTVV